MTCKHCDCAECTKLREDLAKIDEFMAGISRPCARCGQCCGPLLECGATLNGEGDWRWLVDGC